MKKIINIYGIIIATLFFVSCLDDKDKIGTLEFDHVLAVDGIKKTEAYILYLGDIFECNPTISFSEGSDEKDFEYKWLVGKSEVISTDKNLHWEIVLPKGYNVNKEIPGVFIIRNTKNDLEFRQTFNIKILTGYTPTYVALYETPENTIEWISLQGDPTNFTRTFENMIDRIYGTQKIHGKYIGALNSTNELAIFTDHAPDYGYCISMKDADPENDITNNIGEIIAPIYGRVYRGSDPTLDIKNITFGYGASKYLINNGTLHVFNGLEKKLPMFDENTYVKSTNVVQTISSKQFMRYKKVSFVRHSDNTIGCFHVYNDNLERINIDGQAFKLDSLCGEFTEATGLGSNKPYHAYLIGKNGNEYNIYDFYVNYIGTKVQPIELKQIMPLPSPWINNIKFWFGSFGESYGFYATKNEIYKFDYYEMEEFIPTAQPLISFPAEYEIVDIFVQIAGSGLRDEDYCTVVLLYNQTKQATTIYVYDTVSGIKLNEYPDLIPGKGVYFIERDM